MKTAYECGWAALQNGELLAAAEAHGFDAIITTDQNFRYQQHLAVRKIALLVLTTTDWRRIRKDADRVADAVSGLSPGNYVELEFGA